MGAGDVELVDLEDAPVQLLRAWRDRDFKLFLKILNNGYDVNVIYKEENFQPILGVLSRDKDRGKLCSSNRIVSITLLFDRCQRICCCRVG